MDAYEKRLNDAYTYGLTVKEKDLQSSDGRIKGNKIAIRKSIKTSTRKACTLAEEIGHFRTSIGDIIDMSDIQKRKQERQARLWAYNDQIGLLGLVSAYEHHCRSAYEIAEYLEVTEDVLLDAVECYRQKYGVYTTVDNYIIYFIPNLMIGKKF